MNLIKIVILIRWHLKCKLNSNKFSFIPLIEIIHKPATGFCAVEHRYSIKYHANCMRTHAHIRSFVYYFRQLDRLNDIYCVLKHVIYSNESI